MRVLKLQERADADGSCCRFTLNIIHTVPDKYDSVIVEPDATWYTEDMKFGTSSKVGRPPSAEPKVKAEDDGGGGDGGERAASPEKPKRDISAKAVQSLDSDDDDDSFPAAAPRPSSQSRPPARRGPPPGRGQVIDLTLSDSGEEGGAANGPTAQPASPAVQAPNGSPHKRPRIQDDDEDDFVPPTNRPRLEDSLRNGNELLSPLPYTY